MSLELDTKEFLVQYGLMWPTEHQRIAGVFTNAGAVVFHVECACPDIWRVSVLRTNHFRPDESTRIKVRNLLFHYALVRLRREEPFVVSTGSRIQFVFSKRGGEEGIRFIFNQMTRRGEIQPCLERVVLTGCARTTDGFVHRIAG